MKTLAIVLLLTIAFNTHAQDFNLGFESWGDGLMVWFPAVNPNCTVPENAECCVNKCQLNQWGSRFGHGITRTTDAYSGDYAVVVHMWYHGALEQLSLGDCHTDSESYPPQIVSLPSKLYGISGYYKFIADSVIEGDMDAAKMATAHIKTYSINPLTGNLEQATHDSLKFEKADEYQKFEFAVSYPDSDFTPDSVSIWFESNNHNSGATGCAYAHLLYLDEIQLLYEPLSINSYPASSKFVVYPNPANDIIYLDYLSAIQVQQIQLLDLSGKTIKTFQKPGKKLDISGLCPGIYMLRIQSKDTRFYEKILIE